MLSLQRQHSIVKTGDRIIELGTGWLHWDALIWRLFYDVRCGVVRRMGQPSDSKV
jgi:hypothetical protein